jgi:hypothetical protein
MSPRDSSAAVKLPEERPAPPPPERPERHPGTVQPRLPIDPVEAAKRAMDENDAVFRELAKR